MRTPSARSRRLVAPLAQPLVWIYEAPLFELKHLKSGERSKLADVGIDRAARFQLPVRERSLSSRAATLLARLRSSTSGPANPRRPSSLCGVRQAGLQVPGALAAAAGRNENK